MTLILTVLTRHYVVQVSDRLITKQKKKPFDALSNKVVIYRPWDAIVSIGYTGLAFLEGKPTDEWIAERLWGEPIQKPMLLFRRPRHNRTDLGLAVMRLRGEINRVASREGTTEWRNLIEISIAGWYWQQRLARPTYAVLRKRERSSDVSLNRLDRHWHFTKQVVFSETGGWLAHDRENFAVLQTNLNRLGADILSSPKLVADLLAETIRSLSFVVPSIGRDLMMVLIPTPPGEVTVRNMPEHPLTPHEEGSAPTYFTPCIIGTTAMISPSTTQFGYNFLTGDIRISVDVPEFATAEPLTASAQTRPKAP